MYFSDSAFEKATAIVVFPTPGISSSRICPPAQAVISIFIMISSLPITVFFISSADLFSKTISRLSISMQKSSVKICGEAVPRRMIII